MKRWTVTRVGLSIAAVLMAGATLALAQEPGSRPEAGAGPGGAGPGFGDHRPPFEQALGPQGKMGRWWNDPSMVEKLKLTETQRKTMDETLLQHRETLVDLRANVEKAELELEPLMRDDQPNEAKILAQIDKVAQARAELEKANARFLLAIRGKLTPEQWKQLQIEHAKHEEERRGFEPGGREQGAPPAGQYGAKLGGQGHRQPPPQNMEGDDPGPQGGPEHHSTPDENSAPATN